jgi:hypothetical protein
VLAAVSDLVQRIAGGDRSHLTDPRCHNIRWLELL